MKDLAALTSAMEAMVGDPRKGLPEETFLFVSRLVPMVNVDLLITNARGETLLSWRQDSYYGSGWHVPGGIVRFKERIGERIAAVAEAELGTVVQFDPTPVAMNELMSPQRDTRGHFISLLYRCSLSRPPADRLAYAGGPIRPGEWAWHASCPDDLIAVHEIYRRYIDNGTFGGETCQAIRTPN